MYTKLLERFREYAGLIRGDEASRNFPREDLCAEVTERLQQLHFIMQQLSEIDTQFGTTATVARVNEAGETEYYNAWPERDEHLRFIMRLLTESFYYFAFRVRQILRNNVHTFPGLRSFEAVGVRDVRNHLIEHPEEDGSRIFNRTFTWSQATGMQLKTGRQQWESGTTTDAGINANAADFAKQLDNRLDAAIGELHSRQT